jgi:hypothetical protein
MGGNKIAERKGCGPTVGQIRHPQYEFIIDVIKIMHSVPQAKKKALAVNSCRDI